MGYEAYIIFVVQMKGVSYFKPNIINHKAFADVLNIAYENGVKILAYDCIVTPDSIYIDEKVSIKIAP